MLEIDLRTGQHPGGTESYEDALAAENVSLRLLLAQAEINASELLARAGIDAKERDTSDKLQKLLLEELHHRVKNTLATVSAIVSQSLRNVQGVDHAQQAIEGRLLALGRFRIGWQKLRLLPTGTLMTACHTFLRYAQEGLYGRRIREAVVEPPIFILGHWRSGTTLLR